MVLGAVLLAISIRVYLPLVRRVLLERAGRVDVSEVQFPDLIFTLLLTGLFLMMGIDALMQPAAPRALESRQVIVGTGIYAALLLFIIGFLMYRNVSIRRVLGTLPKPQWRVPLQTAGLLLAAYPLVAVANLLMQPFIGPNMGQQEILVFFRSAVAEADTFAIVAVAVMGVLVAPVVEEFIFRGYLYRVCKRYTGTAGAMLFISLLFALVHSNLPALMVLTVLAICLTLAYEWTGSLWVSIGMHALFNATSLAALYIASRVPTP